MAAAKNKLRVLKRELEFLENGGYRIPSRWRPLFIFQDSPVCQAPSCSACPLAEFAVIDLLPQRARKRPIPCLHIPLDETGMTLKMLYATATNEEIEIVLRKWLNKNIAALEQGTAYAPQISALR